VTASASGPLAGVRVVELGVWVAGPSAGAILADWGADVVKVEAPTGDPFRAFFLAAAGVDMPVNPPFELDNRGKRSVCLDFRSAEGAELVRRLAADADVLLTNLRASALREAGLDYPDLAAQNPRLVYARVSGYGERGPDRDRQAYDLGAFWSRAGIAAALTPPGDAPPYMRGGFGDHSTGVATVAGIMGALYARERSGKGQLVATSLMRTGIYVLGFDLNTVLRLGSTHPQPRRETYPNPLTACFRTKDDRWFWLLGLEADRHWPDLVRAVERPEWLDDPRFAHIGVRLRHGVELMRALDAIFATRTRDEWAARFDAAGMWWAPVQSPDEVVADPQAQAAGAFVDVPMPDGGTARMVATPVEFGDTPARPRGPVPEAGQHTEEVLLELGYDWEAIAGLKERKVIP
jgi:crotonobetainyl-CoA:carnitine CoA-transferase CaiB-like acyl-CoA transferase